MVATSLFSLLLLLVAGVLGDAHRRDWRAARDGASDALEGAVRFARRRFVRRTVATTVIALVGLLIAVWPVLPREPFWVVAYLATLMSCALLILTLGVVDAIASSKHLRADARRRVAESAAALRAALDAHGSDDGAA